MEYLNKGDKNAGKEKSLFREMLSWVLYIIIILVLTFLVVHFIGQGTEVSGNSMRPTLEDGDKLVVDKIYYRVINPGRFDVVVFPFQY
ncbi:MAG: signal peptidase I, partial [Lachnospiraceae bacterium]|nr:signal peptidase I [Lachnospiraceae bacterium]